MTLPPKNMVIAKNARKSIKGRLPSREDTFFMPLSSSRSFSAIAGIALVKLSILTLSFSTSGLSLNISATCSAVMVFADE